MMSMVNMGKQKNPMIIITNNGLEKPTEQGINESNKTDETISSEEESTTNEEPESEPISEEESTSSSSLTDEESS